MSRKEIEWDDTIDRIEFSIAFITQMENESKSCRIPIDYCALSCYPFLKFKMEGRPVVKERLLSVVKECFPSIHRHLFFFGMAEQDHLNHSAILSQSGSVHGVYQYSLLSSLNQRLLSLEMRMFESRLWCCWKRDLVRRLSRYAPRNLH